MYFERRVEHLSHGCNKDQICTLDSCLGRGAVS